MKLDLTNIWQRAYKKMIHDHNSEMDNHEYLAKCWSEAVLDQLESRGYIILHESQLEQEKSSEL